MALDIGRLVGYLDLDDKKFDSALGGLEGKISNKTAKFAAVGLVAGAAIAGALATGLNNAMDLQQANNKLSSQLDLTKDQAATAGKVAGDLYANNYGESIEGVSASVGDVIGSIDGMKDANARTVEDMTAKLINLQSAFEIDTARSAQVAGQMVKSGLVDNANEAVDLMTAALQKVPPAMRENIVDAIDEYGPFFKQLGFNGTDAMNALVEGSKKGEYGIDKAGDAIKEFSIRATDLGDKNAQAALEGLGLSGTDMADDLLAGGDKAFNATQRIIQGLLNIKDPGQQASLATALFGTQLEDLNKGQLTGFLSSINGTSDAMGKTAGSADDLGKKLNSGAAMSIDGISRKFQGWMGEAMLPLLPVISGFIDMVSGLNGVLPVLAVALGGAAIAWAVVTLVASPWLALGLGIAAAIAGLIFVILNWGSVMSWLGDLMGTVLTWIVGLWEGFVGWFTGLMDGFFGWWNGIWATVGTAISNGWNTAMAFLVSIPGLILGAFAAAGSWLLGLGRDLFMGWLAGNLAAWDMVWGFITSIYGKVMGALAAAGSWLVGLGRGLLTGFYTGIIAGWAVVWGFITGINGRILGVLGAAGNWLVGTGGNLIRGFASGMTGAIGGVISFISSIAGRVLSAAGNLGSTLLGAGGDLMSGLLRGIRGGLSNILGAIAGMAGDIMGKFKNLLGIHSPSTVFRGYGQNIGEGLLLGLADLHPEVALGIQNMANLQPSSATAYSYSNAYNGKTVLNIEKMGYDPEEIVDEIDRRKKETQDLMGMDTLRVEL